MLDKGKRQQVMEYCRSFRNAKRPVAGLPEICASSAGPLRQVSETPGCDYRSTIARGLSGDIPFRMDAFPGLFGDTPGGCPRAKAAADTFNGWCTRVWKDWLFTIKKLLYRYLFPDTPAFDLLHDEL